MDYTAKLAAFVSRTKYADLPAEVVAQAKLMLLDSLGCALGGYALAAEEVGWIISFAKSQCDRGPSTIWCDGSKTASAFAALANGTMVHTIDFDDTHMGSITHFGSSLLGTVFSLGEQLGSSGKEVLEAFILGLEIGARVGRSVMPSHYSYWHPTATFGGIAAAAAAAKLLKLDPAGLERAIGHAADGAGGLRYGIEKGDFSKSFHAGTAAMRGVTAALLVRQGATGPRGILEYPSGFCNAFATAPDMAPLLADLGDRYEVMAESLKSYPTIQCSHTAIAVVLDLVTTHGLQAEDIKAVRITHTATVPGQGCGYEPDTPLAARLSLPFSIALAVFDGQVTLPQFNKARLHDKQIKTFMAKVTITADEDLGKRYTETVAAMVEIETTDGRSLSGSQIYPKGDPRNRMTGNEVKTKFKGLAGHSFEPDRVAQILTAVSSLEVVERINDLTPLLIRD